MERDSAGQWSEGVAQQDSAVVHDNTAQDGRPWLRLDKRMLLVHPVTELVKFIPVLIGTVILGTSSGNHAWSLIPLAGIIGFALTRWFTTTYRVGPTHVELRTGLIQRKKLSVPRSRIRSVDIEADLLHRLLGLAVLAIGTGQAAESGEKFKLDALDTQLVPGLRAELLAHTAGVVNVAGGQAIPASSGSGAAAAGPISVPPNALPPGEGHEIGHWQPQWVRYAPLSLTGFAIVAPVVGLAFQYGIGQRVFRSDTVHNVGNGTSAALALAVLALVVAIVLVVSVASCAHYLTTYFGLRVTDNGTTLQLRHGLFTTRQITLDLARFRGATVNEPLLLRLAGGAELQAIMTGENPRQKILPQSPRSAVDHTLAHLLAPHTRKPGSGLSHAPESTTPPSESATPLAATTDGFTSESVTSTSTWSKPGPLAPKLQSPQDDASRPDSTAAQQNPAAQLDTASHTGVTDSADQFAATPGNVALIGHGPAARRRRHTRTVGPVAALALALLVAMLVGVEFSVWWWLLPVLALPCAIALAEDRFRGLGHAVLPATPTAPTWLITRAGSLDRDRDCLEAPGVIGWTVRQTFFQRRAGVATVVAATAAGKKRYLVIDIALDEALALIESVTPGRLGRR